jgi:hypothetical protein
MHPSLRPAGDWVSMHPSLSACMREVAMAGCLSIFSFQHYGPGGYRASYGKISHRKYAISVQYASEPVNLHIEKQGTHGLSHPVKVDVNQAGIHRKILTKCVVGADGAHSWTRKTAGIEMLGSRTCM